VSRYLMGLLDVRAVIQVSGDCGGAEGVATTGFGRIDGPSTPLEHDQPQKSIIRPQGRLVSLRCLSMGR